MSPLRQALFDYLAVRRSLGFKLGRAAGLLATFITYAEEQEEQHLRICTMLAWATLPVNTHRNWLAKRLSLVRGFASHLHTIDPATEVPPADLLPWQRCRATPYLYSDDEVAALVTAATSLQTPYRVLTYQTLIGLLAVTGMRVGEAIALDRDDIDMTHGVLTVRLTKFGKSRELPVHPSTIEALVAIFAITTAHVRPQVSLRCLFRIPELDWRTPMFNGLSNGSYAVPESRGDRRRAAPESMIFAIDSQSKPCLTLIGPAKMQKRGSRSYRLILAT